MTSCLHMCRMTIFSLGLCSFHFSQVASLLLVQVFYNVYEAQAYWLGPVCLHIVVGLLFWSYGGYAHQAVFSLLAFCLNLKPNLLHICKIENNQKQYLHDQNKAWEYFYFSFYFLGQRILTCICFLKVKWCLCIFLPLGFLPKFETQI